MKLYGNTIETATKHRCRDTLIYGLQTNQFIREQINPYEVIERIRQMPVFINPRLTASAGRAFGYHHKYSRHIQLHPALIDPKDYVANDFKDTFFHEIAHIIAYICTKKMNHDFTWMYCFKQFGFEPLRNYNGNEFNYRGYRAREAQRIVDAIADDLPDFFENAAKGQE